MQHAKITCIVGAEERWLWGTSTKKNREDFQAAQAIPKDASVLANQFASQNSLQNSCILCKALLLWILWLYLLVFSSSYFVRPLLLNPFLLLLPQSPNLYNTKIWFDLLPCRLYQLGDLILHHCWHEIQDKTGEKSKFSVATRKKLPQNDSFHNNQHTHMDFYMVHLHFASAFFP